MQPQGTQRARLHATTTLPALLLLLLLVLLTCCSQQAEARGNRRSYRRRYSAMMPATSAADASGVAAAPAAVTGAGPVTADSCPSQCRCSGRTVSCNKLGLVAIPAGLSPSVERLNLQSNRISAIGRDDLKGLSRLRILQLQDNAIETIDDRAFNDLVALERLRLNRNQLTEIPEGLFSRLANLHRLDLSHNKLTFIGKDTLSGTPRLRNLQLDHNEIRCLTESALNGLDRLEILTLNKNNISTLPDNAFRRMAKLKTLRLADNNLICDCRLAWLSRWLLLQPQLGLHTRCAHPRLLSGSQVAELASSDFQCSADHHKLYPSSCTMAEKASCPRQCYCQEDIVRCNQKGLTEVPDGIPTNVQELHLEANKISRIRSGSFSRLKQLRRLFLNGNRISQIEDGAFDGVENLYSLVLSRNTIRELPKGIFHGLKFLQLLLLDANKITCLPLDTFAGTKNLAILSLYKNEIKSIAKGTFAPLKSIQQLTIAGNPFTCDCNLRWLNDYLQEHPRLASSDNVCEGPARMARKKLGAVMSRKFRCRHDEADATQNAGRCELYAECPKECKCEADTVDCSAKRLTALPDNLPLATSHLKLADNLIRELPANSILKKLKKLQSIDLSNNALSIIQPESFKENENLEVLNLSGNRISDLDPRMLTGLKKLKRLQLSSNKLTCINNDTFQGVPEIAVLSVSQNQIRCIMEGSFSPLTKLTSLHLDLNPLHCNCHMKWLPPFAVANYRVLRNSQPLCQSPDLLRETPVVSLKSQHFVCQQDLSMGCHGVPPCCSGDAVSCDPRAFCPKMCDCEGTAVRCIGQGLTEIPDHIPVDSTQLFLGQNRIERLNFTRLNKLRNLKLLDLSHNKLFGLKASMFANMSALESLTISFNRLTCIEPKAFAGLGRLKVLILQGNEIASLPFGSFDDLNDLITIGLNQNPLHCDCNVKWLIDFFHKKSLDNGMTLCTSPPALAMKPVYHARPDDFQCTADSQVQPGAKCNGCSLEPCQNGGTCRPLSYDGFACDCANGFAGERCQTRMDACFGGPCHNNATCRVLLQGRYSCQCKPGFEGTHCESNIDDCRDHRCQNNASCEDRVAGYACNCAAGFTGEFCQTRINYCLDYNPCLNAGQCLPEVDSGYRCQCQQGWEGVNCERNIDDCGQARQCMNGGTCVDGVGKFTCTCRPGYTGNLCERLELPGLIMDLPDLVSTGVCTHHECLNGGRCVQEASEYRCQCLAGYEGKKCEKLTQVGFYTDSYAKIDSPGVFPHGNVTLVVATKQRHGLLLYMGGGDAAYMIMSLFDGYIRFSYSLGAPPGVNAYSFVRINDGEFHTVTALVRRETVTLTVDSMAKTISATYRDGGGGDGGDGGASGLQEAAIYVGTLPADKRSNAQANVNIRETFSFGGCVKQMLVNGKLVNFKLSQHSNHKLIAGCPSFAAPANPCEKRSPCKNRGSCLPRPDLPEGYRCNCRPNYTGRHCDDKACKRLVSREFYIDSATGCKSRRQLKIRRCKGTCPRATGYCCQPKKVRHRMIKFACPGGRRITKRVTVVRRCGCGPCGNHDLYSYWYHRSRAAAVVVKR